MKKLSYSKAYLETVIFVCLHPVTDLRIDQIGHGLGPRTFGGPTQLFPMTSLTAQY